MQRIIIMTVNDDQRTQEDVDAAAIKLMDSIQETHFNGIGLRVTRDDRFCIRVDILRSDPAVTVNMF